MSQREFWPPGPVGAAFMQSEAKVRGLIGPVGSGKSVVCCVELYRRMKQQAKGRDGKRRSRWLILRRTFAELQQTTLRTWLDWFPESDFGPLKRTPPMIHEIRREDVEADVIFWAVENSAAVDKLRSFEVTGAYVNEARELEHDVLQTALERTDRFPSMKDGGASWSGLVFDTNAPPEFHWMNIMSGLTPTPDWMSPEERISLVKPRNWEFFFQPPAVIEQRDAAGELVGYTVNPKAENLQNLSASYYANLLQGTTRGFIKAQLMVQPSNSEEGRPVHPDFSRTAHVATKRLEPDPDEELWVGLDFGRTPAAVAGQRIHGRWRILKELHAVNVGTRKFVLTHLLPWLRDHFPKHVHVKVDLVSIKDDVIAMPNGAVVLSRVRIVGDPAGDNLTEGSETTSFQILRAFGLHAVPAPTNDPTVRIETVDAQLTTMYDGEPAFVVDPSCTLLITALSGGYQYKKKNVHGLAPGETMFEDRPFKNRFSHPADALQYLLLGAGERWVPRHESPAARPQVAKRSYGGPWQKTRPSYRRGG